MRRPFRVARRLFATARTPAEVASLSVKQIEQLISPCTFHDVKAKPFATSRRKLSLSTAGYFHAMRTRSWRSRESARSARTWALGIACEMELTGVDIHVHRVTNRWGYVSAKTPEKTMEQLHEKLPKPYRVEINALLVPFGKHVCTGEPPQVFHVSAARNVSAGRRHFAPVIEFQE